MAHRIRYRELLDPLEQQGPLDFLDRFGYLDAARAGVGAVECGAAAPDAL